MSAWWPITDLIKRPERALRHADPCIRKGSKRKVELLGSSERNVLFGVRDARNEFL